MKVILKIIFFFLLAIFPISIFSEQLTLSSIPENSLNISQNINIFEDTTKKLTLEDILKNNNNFQKALKVNKEAINLSYSTSNFWLKLKIKNTSSETLEGKLEIAHSLIEIIEFYQLKDKTYQKFSSGFGTPLNKRPYINRFHILPIEINPGENIYYFKIYSENSILLPFKLWTNEEFSKYEKREYSIQSIYFGIVISMILFNLFLYFLIRDYNYLTYIGFIASVAFAILGITGLGQEIIWKDNPFLSRISVNFFVSLALFIFIFFMRKMLATKKIFPTLDKLLKFFMVVLFITILLTILLFKETVQFVVFCHSISALQILIVGTLSALKKQRVAYFFVIAFAILFLAIMIATLRALGLIPVNQFTVVGPQFGSALEMILLAFALADRYNLLEKEKINAENLVKENLKKSNIELENKVKDRTEVLNQTLQTIKKDLFLAGKIQQNSLYTNFSQFHKIKISLKYQPMAEVGGDYYDITKLNENLYRIFLADATGHGVQAAMITMAIKGIFDDIKKYALKTNEIMMIFNSQFYEKYKSLNSFITGILLDINFENNTITYTSCGHPCMILLKESEILYLEKTGKLLGVLNDIKYESKVIPFENKDRLYLFTDGLFEEFDSNLNEYGEERLFQELKKYQNLSLEESINKVIYSLNSYLKDDAVQDDITIIGIEF